MRVLLPAMFLLTSGLASAAPAEIALRNGVIVPGVQAPSIPAELEAPEGRLFILQRDPARAPAAERWRAELASLGAEVLAYLPQRAHVVRVAPARLDELRALPWVSWVGPFHPAYRIEPALLAEMAAAGRGLPRACNVVAFEEGAAVQERVAGAVRLAGGRVLTQAPDGGGHILRAELDLEQLRRVARCDDVQWIDRVLPALRLMDNVREFHGVDLLETVTGYTGQGVSGEVLDWGTDLAHADFDGIQEHPGQTVTVDPHGTCTYGIVFGNGARDGDGDPRATGMMPGATGWAGQLTTMGNRKRYTEALVHAPMFCVFQSNSWATGLTGAYNSYAFEMDDIVFTYDIAITQAMANSSLNTAVSSQAWAKNVIAVGGIKHKDTLDPTDDTWGVAGCSNCASQGFAEDGSIKPDLASFYENVYTADAEPGGYGPGDYTDFGGTSGATAITAGAVGLLHQMWADDLFGTSPQGATVFEKRPHAVTVRAMLQNQAFRYPIGEWPTLGAALRKQQGWGLANVANLQANASRMNVVDETKLLAEGEKATYCIGIPAGTPDLRITMTYLDPPGAPSATQHRVNDLSLVVRAPDGTVYFGNHGLVDANVSSPGGARNTLDVTEHVFLDAPQAGDWSIVVTADEINEDGHRETGALDADFALVVTGVRCPDLQCCSVDVVTGPGPGATSAPNVRGFEPDGSPNGITDFLAYAVGQWGANVALGNVRTTALPSTDVLTGPGPGDVFGPQVRGFDETGASIGKINFYAYGTLKFGVGAAAADVEDDGYEEILTAPGPGAVFGPHVRAYDVDGGAVGAIAKINFFAFSTLQYGARAVGGSVDPDPFSEILATPGPSPAFGANVRGFDYDGTAVSAIAKVNFLAGTTRHGAHAAAGDVDGDGMDEILAAPGPDPAAVGSVRGYDFDGAVLAAIPGLDFTAITTSHGATVASVDIENDGYAEIVAGAGYAPAAAALVRGFDWDDDTVRPITGLDFAAYASSQGYGVNVAVDAFGL